MCIFATVSYGCGFALRNLLIPVGNLKGGNCDSGFIYIPESHSCVALLYEYLGRGKHYETLSAYYMQPSRRCRKRIEVV